jgi:hypothetical protein
MARTTRQSTRREARVTFLPYEADRSACGMVRVVCEAPGDYALYVGNAFGGYYPSSDAAMAAGGAKLVALAQQAA